MRLPNPFQIFLETKLTDTGKGELMLSSHVISNWFNMDLSIKQLIPFLPAVAIPKARQINDLPVPVLVLIIDIHCP